MRLLLVEDDPGLARSLQSELERSGFAVDTAADGVQGEYLGATESYDLVVLDLGLPKLPGLDVLKSWRKMGNLVPVIVLTARDAWYEKVDGFKAGADDYVGKPFHIEELLARIQALLKRLHSQPQTNEDNAEMHLDDEWQAVCIKGQAPITLTSVEFRLLRYMMQNSGQVLSRAKLFEHIYEMNQEPDTNVIEVYINRLRQKIGKDRILTRRGQGYIFGNRR